MRCLGIFVWDVYDKGVKDEILIKTNEVNIMGLALLI